MADQCEDILCWPFLDAPVFAAIGRARHETLIVELAAQQCGIGKQVIGLEQLVQFVFTERLSRRQPGPQHPNASGSLVQLSGPLDEPAFRVEEARQALDLDVIDPSSGRIGRGKRRVRSRLGAKMLEVPESRGTSEHVEQLQMAGRVVAAGNLVIQ